MNVKNSAATSRIRRRPRRPLAYLLTAFVAGAITAASAAALLVLPHP